MPLVSAKDLLQHAYENNYAVAGMGVQDLAMAQAVIQAASTARSPVILNLLADKLDKASLLNLIPSLVYISQQAEVPVALHLDHVKDIDLLHQAVVLGCNSVLYEPDSNNLSETVQILREFQETYSAFGIALEVSAGHLDDASLFTAELASDKLTRPATAKFLATSLKPASLGIAIGNEHGFSDKTFKIDFARLNKIHAETQQPLVIHGGSGLTEDQCIRLLRKGVAKINFYTDLVHLIESLCNLEEVHNSLITKAKQIFKLTGSGGRAAEVIQQSAEWQEKQLSLIASNNWDSSLLNQLEPYIDYLVSAMPSLTKVTRHQEVEDSVNLGNKMIWCFNFWQVASLNNITELTEFKALVQQLNEKTLELKVLQSLE